MVKATIRQMHVPQLCKCQYHKAGVFTCSDTEREFASHKEMVETLAKYQRTQGNDPCWMYTIVKVG